MPRIPTHRAPTHPGEMLREEFLKPLQVTQAAFAERLGVPFQRINLIVNGHRAITPDTALRFAQALGTTPDLWLNLQRNWDLYHAMRAPAARGIPRIRPLQRIAS